MLKVRIGKSLAERGWKMSLWQKFLGNTLLQFVLLAAIVLVAACDVKTPNGNIVVTACTQDSECSTGYSCQGGACAAACETNDECASGYSCQASECSKNQSAAPKTTIRSGPTGTVDTNGATFSFSCDADSCTFECRLDRGAWASCSSPKSYNRLHDGAHIFSVRAADTEGNLESDPPSRSWTISTSGGDSTPPETTIDSGPTGTMVSGTASFSFSCNEGSCSYECKLDSSAWINCSSPQSYIGISDGSHTFSVRASDSASNVDATPPSRTWVVSSGSGAAVTTIIDSGPTGTVNNSGTTFSFSCNLASCNYECKLDNGVWTACTSPKTYDTLADGSHTFSVRANDGAGSVDQNSPSQTWVVDTSVPDTTPPQTSIDSGPANSSVSNSGTATFSFHCNESGCTYQCQIVTGAWQNCASPKTYTGLSNGPVTFTVRAIDAVGNIDATPANRTWSVDTIPPNSSISGGPSGIVNTTSASLFFSGTDNVTVDYYECSLDGVGWGRCSSPKNYSGLVDGSHIFELRAVDTAGNIDGSPASKSWTVDTIPPNTFVNSGPSGTTNSRSATFTFGGSDANGMGDFECRLNGGSWGFCGTSKSYSGLSNASYTFEVRAVDIAGNIDSSPASRTWTVSCACSSGSCCDGCNYRSASYVCDNAYSTDYQCTSNSCGADAQSRTSKRYCSGSLASCSGSITWNGWSTIQNCSSASVCTSNNSTYPTCIGCTYGCSGGSCCQRDTYEPNDSDSSYSFMGNFDDTCSDNTTCWTINANMVSSLQDKDYYSFSVADKAFSSLYPLFKLMWSSSRDFDLKVDFKCKYGSMVSYSCLQGTQRVPVEVHVGADGECSSSTYNNPEVVEIDVNCSGTDDSLDLWVKADDLSASSPMYCSDQDYMLKLGF